MNRKRPDSTVLTADHGMNNGGDRNRNKKRIESRNPLLLTVKKRQLPYAVTGNGHSPSEPEANRKRSPSICSSERKSLDRLRHPPVKANTAEIVSQRLRKNGMNH